MNYNLNLTQIRRFLFIILFQASQQVLQSNKTTMADYQNEFLGAITTQLRMLHKQDPQADESIVTTYRALLTAIDMVRLNLRIILFRTTFAFNKK